MFARPLAFGLLTAGCVTAAAGGAYLATRQNVADAAARPASTIVARAPASTPAKQPVAETEAAVSSTAADSPEPQIEAKPDAKPAKKAPEPAAAREAAPRRAVRPPRRAKAPAPHETPTPLPEVTRSWPSDDTSRNVPASEPIEAAPVPAPVMEPLPPVIPAPALPRPHEFDEVVVPASSVIGLQVETPLSSERARVEDRVDARVTRDVFANGRVAIPEGSRVIGAVTLVDRGGKMRERARLGIRFHTLVLADGSELPLQTEAIFREGESPSGDSMKKIGGMAVGGAILGAILGGGKGAMIGGSTGAGAGTAAVMASGRHAATLPAGTVVTARITSPVAIQVER